MGCLKKFFKMIIIGVILFAFFALGGYAFVKNKYDNYTKPERSIFIQEEKDFGNLENVSADYVLSRSLNWFGYRKLNAFYVPKHQKITILDLNSDKILTEEDFVKGTIEKKLEDFSAKAANTSLVPIEEVEVTNIGKIKAGTKLVSYVDFDAKIKMVPFFKLKGTVAIYETKNRDTVVTKVKDKIQNNNNTTTKLLLACKFPTGYDDKPVKKFIKELGL